MKVTIRTLHVALPPLPLAVAVYVLVDGTVIIFEPEETGLTEPIAWSTVIDVAFAVVHCNTVWLPARIYDELAAREHDGFAATGGT